MSIQFFLGFKPPFDSPHSPYFPFIYKVKFKEASANKTNKFIQHVLASASIILPSMHISYPFGNIKKTPVPKTRNHSAVVRC